MLVFKFDDDDAAFSFGLAAHAEWQGDTDYGAIVVVRRPDEPEDEDQLLILAESYRGHHVCDTTPEQGREIIDLARLERNGFGPDTRYEPDDPPDTDDYIRRIIDTAIAALPSDPDAPF